ncbi:MAG TPA: hypothetical protein VEG08_12660, partial [Terriglobales bacterium]|nr:hypothetical protein [Terriglobales bacterium]
ILFPARVLAALPGSAPLDVKVGSIDLPSATIVEALRELRMKAGPDKVFFTVEVVPFKTGPERNLRLHLTRSTVGGVLRSIIRQDPRYDFEVLDSKLVHVFPRTAKQNAEDLLNTPVRNLRLSAPYDILLQYPQYHVPELQIRMFPRGSGPGSMLSSGDAPAIEVTLATGTVRDVLNLVAQKSERLKNTTPKGWIYCFRVDPSLSLGGQPSWQVF